MDALTIHSCDYLLSFKVKAELCILPLVLASFPGPSSPRGEGPGDEATLVLPPPIVVTSYPVDVIYRLSDTGSTLK